jgi:hypothetical protein
MMEEHRLHGCFIGPDDTDEAVIRRDFIDKLIKTKGFRPEDLDTRLTFEYTGDGQSCQGVIDVVIRPEGRLAAAARCAPGSVVSRQRQALAAVRLAFDRPPALSLVYNGDDVQVTLTADGRAVGDDWDAVPDRRAALDWTDGDRPTESDAGRKAKEAKIFQAFETFKCGCDPG